MAQLLFLGTSAGIPTAKRHCSSMVIKKDDRLYLIDCGGPVSSMLKSLSEDPRKVEAVFLTHWHPDHASGLPMLIQDLQLSGRERNLTIYGPEGTNRKVKLLQNIFILPPDIYPFELSTIEYTEKTIFTDGKVDIHFFKTRHLSQDSWRNLDGKYANEIQPVAYGFVVFIDGQKIVISGDLLNSDDLLPYLSDANLVIHEFGHINPNKLNSFVRRQQISKLIISHIHHEWDDREDELKEIVSDGHSGEVHIARDLWRFTL